MSNAWEQTADNGQFRCWVEQTGDGYSGILRVEVVETGEVLISEPVSVAYAARFGPDMEDVGRWQDRSIQAIDEWIARQEAGS